MKTKTEVTNIAERAVDMTRAYTLLGGAILLDRGYKHEEIPDMLTDTLIQTLQENGYIGGNPLQLATQIVERGEDAEEVLTTLFEKATANLEKGENK